MKALRSVLKSLADSLRVVGRSRGYSVYPLLSFVIVLLITYLGLIPLFERALAAGQDVPARLVFFLAVYLAYGVLYFVCAFGNVALVVGIAAQLDGEQPRLTEGFVRAVQRLALIGVYTLISATLGLLGFLARTLINPIFGMFVAPAVSKRLWTRWQQLAYSVPLLMEVPIIALDRPAPKDAYARGDALVKATWGERVKPSHSIELLALLVMLPIIIVFATPALQQGAAAHDTALVRRGLAIMLLSIGIYTQLSALVNATFALAAYCYATARKRDMFPNDPSYAEQAFVASNKADKTSAAPVASRLDATPATAEESSN